MIKRYLPFAFFLIGFVFFVSQVIIPATREVTHGYMGYFAATQLVVTGEWGAQAYDDAWMSHYVLSITDGKISEIISPNLPTSTLIMLPLAGLSAENARVYWSWVSAGLYIAGLVLLAMSSPRGFQPWYGWFMGGALLFTPSIYNFTFGQVGALTFFLLCAGAFGIVRHAPRLAGMAFGLVFTVKTYGVLLWFMLLVKREWKILGWIIGTFLAIFLIFLPWLGFDSWIAVVQSAFRVSKAGVIANTAYQTTPSFFAHLFRGDPIWNPHPLFQLPWLATILPLVCGIIAVWVTFQSSKDQPAWGWLAAWMPLQTLFLPNALEHHFMLFLITIFISVDRLRSHPIRQNWLEWSLLGLGILLTGLPLPYKHPLFAEGWLSLLAYPRFYGGWLLWGVAILTLRQKRE